MISPYYFGDEDSDFFFKPGNGSLGTGEWF